MSLLRLAAASLASRKTNALLTLLSIAISVMLLLGVERVSEQTRTGFANTISGTDLIVGARSGPVNLMLFSVFHIGNPTTNVSWEGYTHWRDHDQVAWSIPIALGDSFRGQPVIATDTNFFQHFQYGDRQPLRFAEGEAFANPEQVVLGAGVARKHGLTIGDSIVIAHGTGSVSFQHHDEDPVVVSGVLNSTGTPVDQAVYIPLRALAQMHGQEASHDQDSNAQRQPDFSGATQPDADDEHAHDHEHAHDMEQPVESLSAFFLGLHSKPRAIFMQRAINTWGQEPLTALMPGATLQELWRTLNVFEQTLSIVSGFVLLTGLMGMLATLIASLQERRREMAVLRSLGAGPGTVFMLLVSEAMLLTAAGIAAGIAMLYALMLGMAPWLQSSFGIVIEIGGLSAGEWQRVAIVAIAALVISCLPAWRAYRNSLTDGLSIRL